MENAITLELSNSYPNKYASSVIRFHIDVENDMDFIRTMIVQAVKNGRYICIAPTEEEADNE